MSKETKQLELEILKARARLAEAQVRQFENVVAVQPAPAVANVTADHKGVVDGDEVWLPIVRFSVRQVADAEAGRVIFRVQTKHSYHLIREAYASKALAMARAADMFVGEHKPKGLTTWREEFYCVPAGQVSKADALQHSIQKWKGLSPAQLRRHSVRKAGHHITDGTGEEFFVSAGTCALCFHFWSPPNFASGDTRCKHCPVQVHTGQRCAHAYELWCRDGDTGPMVELLCSAQKRAQQQKAPAITCPECHQGDCISPSAFFDDEDRVYCRRCLNQPWRPNP